MSVFETNRPAALNGLRAGTAFTNLFAALAAWNDARITRNALGRLSDRELDDIGLIRGDIDMIAANDRA